MSTKLEKILITGSTGLLGPKLARYLRSVGHEVLTHGRGTTPSDCSFDLTDRTQALTKLKTISPTVIINLVALTNVDTCEKNPQQAYLTNVLTVENLATHLKQSESEGPFLIHISTDQVYDGLGEKREPEITLLNTYAWSKYCSEQVVLRAGGICLRTNFLGRSETPGRKSFSDWVVDHFSQQLPINLFDDILFSPLSIGTLTEMIAHVVGNKTPGVFNLGSRNGLSKAQVALQLACELGFDTGCAKIVSSQSAPLTARRPKDMRMNSSLFENRFGVSLPDLKNEVTSVGREYEIPKPHSNRFKNDRNRTPDILHS